MRSKSSQDSKKIISITGNDPNMGLDAWWWLVAGVIGLTTLMVVLKPDPFWNILKFVSDGIRTTVLITIVSFILILVVGLLVALGRLSHNRLIYGSTSLYVELIRGIPLMVQLIWWYYAFPAVLINFGKAQNISFLAKYKADAFLMAVLGLAICYAAYMSEIYRAGIQSIPKGQMEAARSLGMNYIQAMRHIILPQAIRIIMPPVGNEFIALLKDSSLVSVVAVVDMTRRGREYMAAHFNPIEVWSLVALLYLIMTLCAARMVNYTERRTRIER